MPGDKDGAHSFVFQAKVGINVTSDRAKDQWKSLILFAGIRYGDGIRARQHLLHARGDYLLGL